MIRKFTSMGLALVAVLALGAVMASGAMAAEFHSEATSTTITGTQTTTHKFTVGGGFGAITCKKATFSGTTSSTSTTSPTQTITPTYAECSDSFGRTATVNFGSCDYVFHATGGTVDLVCSSGDVTIVIETGSTVECTVTLQAQNGINGQSYANGTGKNGKKDITETSSATNITASTTSSGGLGCGIANGTHTGGTYTGTTTLEGSSGIWWE
jgi:hypothetical protein